ncbi:type VI secretion protein ImpB [Bifidobacterium dolichotidis]|uniref:Type VI secretion protein ImpB n=2 Tax=Bifidobacterium dolichotidis TaxID=2306976 RepID=A0A430FPP3_9BIFI|nr:type VI secretion protein ImpB [Bifidobacterium dolichotidis]RSX54807.1 type VI secretion protein ImpB [Bifidobacterium dolichotidis]
MSRLRTYLAIDLKSFYASAECVQMGLDPLTTNLVVADASRTSKTICLAVSPSLKAHGIAGRARLFEVEQAMKLVNEQRRLKAPGRKLGPESSVNSIELAQDPHLRESFVIAKPRMSHYVQTSAKIYSIYLQYASAEDIHVYSIDEVFIDATKYLRYFQCTGHELARRIVADIARQTGITATAGVGTNMYLAKVAMDIVAKHIPADKDGVRIAELDEASYRHLLWNHKPLTDFWRVGKGIAKRLAHLGIYTMGDIARCSIGGSDDYYNEDLLYRMFGVNAELLIDHAWGWEPCTIADIKAYHPSASSLSTGQVLPRGYDYNEARTVVAEMADELALSLVAKGWQTNQVHLGIGYERLHGDEAVSGAGARALSRDRYGRLKPKSARGSMKLGRFTAASSAIREAMLSIFRDIADPNLQVRRLQLVAVTTKPAHEPSTQIEYEQPDLFAAQGVDDEETVQQRQTQEQDQAEVRVQQALLNVKQRFGANAVFKGIDLDESARTRERNTQIGGHSA